MLLKMVKKDVLKNKSITIALFIFIALSALLVASGSMMIVELSHSLNALFTKASAPHFVQMHAGEIDQTEIGAFASSNSLVKNSQTVEMVVIDNTDIDFGGNRLAGASSLMDHYFVKQNHSFDLLLNLESEVIQVSEGEIAVPIYYMQQHNLKIGDKIRIFNQAHNMEFTVVDFVRDVQMNSSIIHSKRFVVNKMDLETLKKSVGQIEYLIEFQLTDLSRLSEFRNAYQSSNLPNKGPTIDYHLLKSLNAITDGIVAAVVLLVSLLLSIIAILCLRFTILAAIEEDYREIGVLKAIGIGQKDLKKIYLLKYIVIAALASLSGYVASLFLNQLFTANIMLYIGTAPKSMLLHSVPFTAVIVIFFIVVCFCLLILRRFNQITTVEALRSGSIGETQIEKKGLSLGKSTFFNVHIFLGLRDVFVRFKTYGLLFFIFVVCSFIIIVPVNFLTTIQSPDFTTYMGIERSDIRIDLQQSDPQAFNEMLTYIENDKDVEHFSPLVTSQFKVINSEGVQENMTVETGDFSIFPLEYVEGAAPIRDNEMALSYLNSKELQKSVGDHLQLLINGQEKEMVVSGIYQDVTNGGRTAKALVPFNQEMVLWYKVSVDIKSDVTVSEKMNEYAAAFYPARVTDLEGYLAQTFANTIEQLTLLTIVAIVLAIFVAVLITALFLKMVVAKEYSQIAIMRSMGFTLHEIRLQYVTRAFLVLGIGIVLGTLIANTGGQSIVSAGMSMMGASDIKFVIDPVQAYILCPLLLLLAVTITTLMSLASIKESSIAEMNA